MTILQTVPPAGNVWMGAFLFLVPAVILCGSPTPIANMPPLHA